MGSVQMPFSKRQLLTEGMGQGASMSTGPA